MSDPIWRLSAADLAAAIRNKTLSARQAVDASLVRIAEVNPLLNALPYVLADEARAAADAADKAVAAGVALGPLHGVPVAIKVNVDQAGWPTTDGLPSMRDNIAAVDSPPVANLRRAGAIIIGRSNTPAFSVRWFTDNDLHGRTRNPWNPGITPGGSSGGAAAAVASGMCMIGHGNDYGGSVRYPAYACGVVGLRATVGRIPAFNATARGDRSVTSQMMSVQGPLTRSIADARLALHAMAAPDARDPNWVPAPLEPGLPKGPIRVAMFAQSPAHPVDPAVSAAVRQAGAWLAEAGFAVEETAPPDFTEAAALWRTLVYNDLRRAAVPAINQFGDAAVRDNIRLILETMPDSTRDSFLDGLARRYTLAHKWSLFFETYPILLMPVSWQRPFRIDADTISSARSNELVDAQGPMLATALLGLPGLSVPTGLVDGVPMGVQLCATRFREDLILYAGAAIEAAAGYLVPDM